MVFVSHLLGLRGDVEKIREIFPHAVLIEDICESHGCRDANQVKAGAHSVGATFSFYFGHHMTSIEGGMVSTCNAELYDLMKMKRSHGMARHSAKFAEYTAQHPEIDASFLFVTDGYNFRNTELAAVLGMSQLGRLDDFVKIRQDNYLEVMQILNRYGMLFEYHEPQTGNSSFCFPVICHTREIKHLFIESCKKHGVEHRPVVSGNLLKQPFLKKYSNQIMPHAQKLHENGVYIGNNQFVGKKELHLLETICEEINPYY
jgi:CDP-6-deoxy-D-xylo-4-hexulose-3-dehydrase